MGENEGRRTILVADDDADLSAALGHVLTAAGYRVIHAADGESCLKLAQQERPDLVLLDLIMPFKDGFETCRALRETAELCTVPIIALTAFGENIGESHGLSRNNESCPIQDFLEKPIELNVLLDRIQRVLEGG